jgi:hypothetical protein
MTYFKILIQISKSIFKIFFHFLWPFFFKIQKQKFQFKFQNDFFQKFSFQFPYDINKFFS